MSGLGKLIGQVGGAAVGEVVQGVGSALGDLALDLRAAITGETVLSEETKLKLAEIADRIEQRGHELKQSQAEINKVEAAHPSIFVSGWRPFIGWVLGFSLATYYIPKYILAAIFWTKACWTAQALVPYPVGADDLLELILGMLGLAAVRTYEKTKDVARVR